ncbi:Major facilitator superfamily transporter [Cordyceps militaris CM01]|uniref:Major facilitator superfamily transporter n=1 Tax=Cordyceps militaris (strain CM01) TaxID=983644 RepID=G3JRV1_CORMM|nr:Major facilitator superfamily transporter [Cordyceps militaris CM01]EGX88544.1 Major facilitator superfamily transporter [Cordyceps militaris CM01]
MPNYQNEPPGTLLLFTPSEDGRRQEIILHPEPTNSPNDPLTWPIWRKAWHASVLVVITGLAAGLSTLSGAASFAMNNELHITPAQFNVAVAVLFVGIGGGTYLMSPLPRLLGRRISYVLSLVAGIAGCVMFVRVQRLGLLIVSHLFLGVAESCAEAMVQHSLSDIFFEHQRGSAMGLYVLALSGGTFMGPLAAGLIASSRGWRAIGWAGAACCGVMLVVMVLTLEETTFDRAAHVLRGSDPESGELEKRTSSQQQLEHAATTCEPTIAGSALDQKKSYLQRIRIITPTSSNKTKLMRGFIYRLRHSPRCFVFPAVLFSGVQWGAQITFLTFYLSVSDVQYYAPPWNYSDKAVALMAVPCLIGLLVGILYASLVADYFVVWMARRNSGILEAEHRLWLVLPASVTGSLGLLLFGIGSQRGWGWPVPYFGLGCFGFTWGCAGDISLSYMQQVYPEAILECMVGVAVINNIFGCSFTFAAGPWLEKQTPTQVFSVLAVINFVVTLLAVPMIIWGKRMRAGTAASYLQFVDKMNSA